MTRRYHEGTTREERARIYDEAAPGYSARFSDPSAVATRQLSLLTGWGMEPRQGASVLEIGCADGYVTAHLARAGLRTTAVDLSPRMIEVAAQRLKREGLQARLAVCDIEEGVPEGPFDVVMALMRNYFSYIDEPRRVLEDIYEQTTQKVLVDCDPRTQDLDEAIGLVGDAGFKKIEWRPFFIPQRFRLGRPGLGALKVAERVPPLRDAILKKKFLVVIKGERV